HRAARALLAGAHADVEHAVDGGGVDLDAHLAFARHRIRRVLILEHVGRAELVDHGCFHGSPWCLDHSTRAPVSRTMLCHLAASAVTSAANSAVVMLAGSMKLPSRRLRISGSSPTPRT